MRTLKEIREELDALLDAAKAIQSLAEKESRELTAEESAEWTRLMDEESGLVVAKQAEFDHAVKLDRERKALAVARTRSNESHLGAERIDDGKPRAENVTVRHAIAPLQAFRGETAARDAYDCGHWLRAMLAASRGRRDEQSEAVIARRGWDIRASQTEGTATAGGYLVPDPLEAAFIEYRQAVGVMRNLADVHVMTADTLNVPKLTSGQTVRYPGEAGAITASDEAWGQVAFSAVKRSILSYVSQELKDDAIINIMDQAVSRMAYQFALQEDNEAINGDGTSTYGGETGILTALGAGGVSQAASGHDTWPEIDAADVTAWLAKLPSQHSMNETIVCSRAFYFAVLYRLMVSAGGNTVDTLMGGGGGRYSFYGIPVVLTDRMPTATAAATVCALYGNFPQAIALGDRSGLEFATSDQYAFNQGLLAIRGVTRYDWNAHNCGDGSNAGAVVALKTAA